jgi:hypothetical protein
MPEMRFFLPGARQKHTTLDARDRFSVTLKRQSGVTFCSISSFQIAFCAL